MGYRSDIAIAVHKNIFSLDLIHACIPEILKKEPHTQVGDAFYWFLSGWKWYEGYAEIQAIESFFNYMDAQVDPIKINNGDFTYSPYGALRIGADDDDVQSWGDPNEYQIYLQRSIDSPFTGT